MSDSFVSDKKVEIEQGTAKLNNDSFIDGIPAVTWGDGVGNPANAMGYLATLGYDFNSVFTDGEGKNYYYRLCCFTRDGGGGYDAHLVTDGPVTQERINGLLRIYINNVQYGVERTTARN